MIERIYQQYQETPNVQTDTRKLRENEIFFALRGPHYDANTFVAQALAAGASLVVCERHDGVHERVLVVDDALHTLQKLAAHHRNQFRIPFLAITGSNGKTTTKELIHSVLSTSYVTYTTEGNLNNHIGVPLTILKIRPDAEMAVVEMGANHLGEIASYCKYAMPTHGLITNIGKAHLEGFGGADKVKIAKGELFDYLAIHDGYAFVNADDTQVVDRAQKITDKTLYGIKAGGLLGRAIAGGDFLNAEIIQPFSGKVYTRLVGDYNLPNILAAVCVGNHFGIGFDKIRQALEAYTPGNSRSQLVEKDGNKIILDAYNANPASMAAAIKNFAAMSGDKKMLLLGEMKELGVDSQAEHEHIVRLIRKYRWEKVVLVGNMFAKVAGSYLYFSNSGEASDWFKSQKLSGYRILVKGSRSMKMESVVSEG